MLGTPWKQIDRTTRWDAVVVGSGIGGLATAALLARHAGPRMLVLERHYVTASALLGRKLLAAATSS